MLSKESSYLLPLHSRANLCPFRENLCTPLLPFGRPKPHIYSKSYSNSNFTIFNQIREGQREIRQKFEEIESECRRLREETMDIASQSDYNQIRINLMLGILKARQDSDFARADHPTRLLREEMEKQEQGGKAGLVG